MRQPADILAVSFVDLVLKYRGHWHLIVNLVPQECAVLYNTLEGAGFTPERIILGHVYRPLYDSDRNVMRMVQVNHVCAFKVVHHDGTDDSFTTGWLDCAFRRVLFGDARQHEDRATLIRAMEYEIQRSRPLSPIALTLEGDALIEQRPVAHGCGLEYFVDHTRDTDVLDGDVGIHRHCGGIISRHPTSRTHDVLICRQCFMRITIPYATHTYGDLRALIGFPNLAMQV